MKALFYTLAGIGLITINFTVMQLKAADCEIRTVARCPFCVASAHIRCRNGNDGYVRNNTRVAQLRVVITSRNGNQRTVTLENPPGGIRDYYPIESNDWVATQLGRNLRWGDEIEIANNGIKINDNTILYSDVNARSQTGTAGRSSSNSSASSNEYYECSYLRDPGIISIHTCQDKLCVGNLTCNHINGTIRSMVSCPAINETTCPTATICANDSLVTWNKNRVNIQVPRPDGIEFPVRPLPRRGRGTR